MNQIIINRINKIKQGQVTEGYKKTDLGVFPVDWETRPIGSLLKIRHGRSQHGIEDENGVYPILATGGVIGRTNRYLCSKPCVLIGRKGTINKPQYMDTPFWTVDTLFFSDIQNQNSAKYLYYMFLQINWNKYNESTGVPSLSARGIENIKVICTLCAKEQERIAEILMKWDEAIELQELYIDKLKVRKKALMQKLLTSKIDWIACPLGKFITLKNGYAFKSMTYLREGKYKIITIKNVQHGLLDLSEVDYIDSLPRNIQNHQVLNIGDIIISLTGNVGRTCYVNSENCLLNQRVAKVETKNTITQFIFAIFQTEKFLYYMQNIAQGCAQANLSNKDVEDYVANFPVNSKGIIDLEKEKNIANILANADIEIGFHQQKLGKIKEQRKALMQLLLAGIVRVK